MKIKHPKTLWVVFDKNKNHVEHIVETFEEEPCQDSWCRKRYYALKPYHLSPGNEVARALNVYDENNLLCRSVTEGAKILRKAGFHVRWDARKGQFV